ncbi:MAG: AAA family ATPase [Actinomycetota bacterium]|nr:AAA family ATPase [Actinomycetota bacterium]
MAIAHHTPARALVAAATEAERNLLAAMMLSRDALVTALALHPSDFSDHRHQAIFDAAVALAAEGHAVDTVTVESKLADAGQLLLAGGHDYLVDLLATTSGLASHADSYVALITDHAQASRIRSAALAAVDQIDSGVDPAAAYATLAEAAIDRHQASITTMAEGLDRVVTLLETDSAANRIPTSLPDLDQVLLGGFAAGQLAICGARPATGKSAFAGGVAFAAAQHGHPVLFVTAEMSVEELMVRMLSRISGIPSELMTASRGPDSFSKGEWTKLAEAMYTLEHLPISFIEASPTVAEIRSRVQARTMTGQTPYELVVIDYLQLLTPAGRRNANRQEDVSEMSRALKRLAMDGHVAILALSQLSRALELRADKRPILADLRESGSLEQDSDIVMFLHRPEMYEPGLDPGIAEVIVAKQRNGPLGTTRAAFLAERAALMPLAGR